MNLLSTVVERAYAGLSKEQRAAFLVGTNRMVTACPGSGKTRGIAARAAVLSVHGERVALASFTNVGAEEIALAIRTKFSFDLDERGFIGTLHGLLLRYVYRPFAASIMGSTTSPVVRLKPSGATVGTASARYAVDDFHFDARGELSYRGWTKKYQKKEAVAADYQREVRRLKFDEARSGSANASDALYWSLVALQQSPIAAATVAARFDEIIVDEAQDTASVQEECLRLIVKTDLLQSLFLVGDFDQSIYSFQGASVAGMTKLAEDAKLEKVPLTENHRSSQLICNVSARLRSKASPDTAVGRWKDETAPPALLFYKPKDLATLPATFESLLRSDSLDPARSAVVTRSNKLLSELGGASRMRLQPGTLTAALVDVVSGGLRTLSAWRLRNFEDLLRESLPVGVGEALEPAGLRGMVVSLVDDLSNLREATISAWVGQANSIVMEAVHRAELETMLSSGTEVFATPLDSTAIMSQYLVEVASGTVEVATVHAVKGRSLDAVMVVADYEDPGWRPPEWTTWMGFLGSEPGPIRDKHLTDEEFRILYVALTRAERRCYVALPDEAMTDGVLQAFHRAGFALPQLA